VRVNRQALADILGVSKPTISSWIDDGLPFTRQGSKAVEWVFDTAEVIRWYAEFKRKQRADRGGVSAKDNPFVPPGEDGLESEDQAKARKERALADRNEIEVAKALKVLVPIDEVTAIVVEEHTRVKTRITAIPNELRPVLLTHLNNDRKAVEACVAKVEKTINAALEEIVSYAGEGDDADEERG